MAKRARSTRKPSIRVVLVTAPVSEAEKLAHTLVEEKLAACANLLPGITSLYWWEGKLNRDSETLIVFKARSQNMKKLLARLKQLHSYKVPEFLALPVREANPDYIKWAATESTPVRIRK